MGDNIRVMNSCGVLYPEDKEQLSKMIDEALDRNKEKMSDKPMAIITPYGSYKYAIDSYATSYSQVVGEKYDTVIIISPIHKFAFPGIALTNADAYSSQFGDIFVDKEANKIITDFRKEFITFNDEYHKNESAVEVQLPFLYKIFGEKIKIVPVIIGESNTKFTTILANSLKNLIDKTEKKYLIIAVTNLSTNIKYDEAVEKDNLFINYLLENNPDHLAEQLAMKQVNAFGGGGIITILRLAVLLDKKNIRVLRLLNTGDTTGEKLKVESYISSVVF